MSDNKSSAITEEIKVKVNELVGPDHIVSVEPRSPFYDLRPTQIEHIDNFRSLHASNIEKLGIRKSQYVKVTMLVKVTPHRRQDPVSTFISFFQSCLLPVATNDPRISPSSPQVTPEMSIVKIEAVEEKTNR